MELRELITRATINPSTSTGQAVLESLVQGKTKAKIKLGETKIKSKHVTIPVQKG